MFKLKRPKLIFVILRNNQSSGGILIPSLILHAADQGTVFVTAIVGCHDLRYINLLCHRGVDVTDIIF